MTEQQREKILIVGPAWVGDMVMAQSLFISLKQLNPACEIVVLAPAWTEPLLARMPEVDDSIRQTIGHGELKIRQRLALGKSLRSANFSKTIILPNSFKSALVPLHARIPERIAWRGEWRDILLTDSRKLDESRYPLMVQRFVALAYAEQHAQPLEIPQPKLAIDPRVVEATLRQFKLDRTKQVVAICPGAEFGAAKQWPAAHYTALARESIAAGSQVWIFGSAKDRPIADQVAAELDSLSCKNLAGETDLAQAIDLMSVASVVVSNDSGLMHIAAALERPVVGIYGSTSPDFTPPLAEKVKLLATDIQCRPCFKRQCPYGHLRCLTELEPKRVIEAVAELHASLPE